ncbi:MAG: hypothetical protein DHS20C18_12990 [Saprospiraceae bacterium]|nr:MAG: hypothetical protein DHS20C18_12990 [Saprospiraceae bacterium]
MDLQQLATDLRSKVTASGELTLDNSVIKQGSFVFVLSYFKDKKIDLSGISQPDQQISVKDKTLTISGKEELFGQTLSTNIELVEKSDTELTSAYNTTLAQVTFDNLISWDIIPTTVFNPASILPKNPFDTVGMSISSENSVQTWSARDSSNTITLVDSIGLKLSKLGFSISRFPDPLTQQVNTSFSLIGTFELGQTNLTVGVTVPISTSSPAGQWNLTLSSTSTLADGIADISQLVFGNNVFAALPPGFQDALEFSLEELLINFYLDERGVKFSKIVISRTKAWQIVDNFTILEARAAFMLNKVDKKFQLATNINGKFQIGTDNSPAKVLLDVAMSIPAGNNDWMISISGSLENNSIDDLFTALPVGNGQSLPEFPVGLKLDSITLNFLNIAFNPSSKKLSYISFSVESELEFGIFNILTVQNPYAALDIQSPSTTKEITGNIGGNLVVADLPLALKADKPSSTAGWTFSAGMLPGTKIPILKLVEVFLKSLNITKLPDWIDKAQLNIEGVFFSAYVPTATSTDQTKKYHVEGSVMWQIDINSFALPELKATVSADFENGKASGMIAVEATVLMLPFKVGYKFGTPDTEVYLEWLGIQADYKHNATTKLDTITVTFADMSVGEIITHLIESFEPGFQLPPPWDKLNSINLSGLSLIYTRSKEDSTKNKIVIAYTKKIDLKFLEIDEITLTKDSSGVFIGFKGKFLGIPITSENPDTEKLAGKGSDVRDMGGIPVPGMGDKYFDLEYLGLGQHVTLYPFEDLKTVEQAVDRLKNVFKEPEKPKPGKPPILPIPAKPSIPPANPILVFDENSNWLVGTKFTIMEAITLGVVFNDPNLYGLLVGLNGDKVKVFNGLKFQILYKKVNDSVGVYQIELKLPDAIRELQFGAVSVTLPIIGVDIYTNGSFRLDFGFPYKMDFSRSLTIQAFPFTGSGGFYFAYLHGVPSDKVPVTTVGVFNPIIEFGLGLQLGVGKSINKGILKAGFSITAVGILEGVVAWFEPNKPTTGKKDLFYRIEATVGLVGRLYGEINFAIISASLDVTVYAYVQMVVEAFRAIPIYLEAGVSVSLRVTINLGIFKIHVNLHFSAKISASFTIGHDTQAPWDEKPPLAASFASFLAVEPDPLTVKWQPLVLTSEEKQPINLYLFPQLTVASQGASQVGQFANLLYIDAPVNKDEVTSSLNNLVKGILYWSINAVVNSDKSETTLDMLKAETVSAGILKQLHAYLSDTKATRTPIPYSVDTKDDIENFLQNFFNINVLDIEQAMTATAATNNEINASIFPILPLLKLAWELKGEKHDLSAYNIDNQYIDEIQAAFKQLQVDYQNKAEKGQDEAEQSAHQMSDVNLAATIPTEQTMPAFIFQDYILMIAKSAIQDVIEEMEAYQYAFTATDTLKGISDSFNKLTFTNPNTGDIITNELSPGALAAANKTVNIKQGLTFEIPNIRYQVQTGDSFQSIVDLFNKGLAAGNQITLAQLDYGGNASIQGLVAAGTPVNIENFPDYQVLAGQTLAQIAGAIKNASMASPTVAQVIETIAKDTVLLSLAVLDIPTLGYEIGATDSFEILANNYGITLETLANNVHNAGLPGIFDGQTIAIPQLLVLGVETVVNTFDTNDNIARISAMTSRFFLHGMRLPIPQDMTKYDALYQLTGQQFPIPAVAQDDAFSIQLSKPENTDWISFNGAVATNSIKIDIDNPMISRINNLNTIQLNPDTSPMPPQSIPMGQESPETFSLKTGINWQYPGKLVLPIGTPIEQTVPQPTIWNFSEALMGRLEQSSQDLDLQVMKLIRQKESGGFKSQSAQNYAFSTLLQVTVQKLETETDGAPLLKNTYELIGADDTSIVLLERLLQYMNSQGGKDDFIQQIQLLYPPSAAKTEGTPSGLQSAVNGGLETALIQTNLSTETNPIQGFSLLAGGQTEKPGNTLNTFHDFISLLWQCSIVRSGGYYLLYQTKDGGDGLPDQLFSQGKDASIYLLITYTDELSKAFVNSAVIADNINTSTTTVYVEAEALKTMVAIAPPGNAGFELERVTPADYTPVIPYPIPPTPESKQQDINYLNRQYNLLGYQLLANADFKGIDSLLPVGPTNDMSQEELNSGQVLPNAALAEENWKYKSLLPLARHAIQRIQPKKPTYPSAANDPYAGIGANAKVRLNWQDMLGNSLQTPLSDGSNDISLQFLYTDQLVAISKWTSVSAYYSFPLVSNQPNLQVDLVVDTGRYQITQDQTKEDVIQNALVDQVIYSTVYYQLIQKAVQVSLTSSINAEAANHQFNISPETLSNFAGEMYAYLESVVNDPATAVPPANISISQPIELANSKIIFELTVDLSIERTKHIDPTFAHVEGIAKVVTALKPVTSSGQENGMIAQAVKADETVSLTAFAEQFEASYKDRPAVGNFLKIAVGIDRDDISSGPSDKKVWVVHFDRNGKDGMFYEFDNSQQYFYSPMPLANNLETYEQVPINGYKSGEAYPYGTAQNKNFNGIDLDSWGRQCLDAIDQFLSPELAVPAFLLDDGESLQAILDAKEKIAEGIAGTVTNILDIESPDQSSLENAKEKLKQRILIQLSNAYKIDAVVQNAVQIKHGFSGSNEPTDTAPFVPKLYGKMVGSLGSTTISAHAILGAGESPSEEYSLSTAKVPLGTGTSWLTYLFDAKEAEKHSNFNFSDMQFRISYIEHQIDTVADMGDYRASSWLTFIIPIETSMTEVGPVDIPIPLRAYPTPPSVINQQTIYKQTGNPSQTVTIPEAKLWGYQFSYQPPAASQDQIQSQLQFNVDETINQQSKAFFQMEDGSYNPDLLPATLAQFIIVYPEIYKDFTNALAKIVTTTAQDDPLFKQAAMAVQAFGTIIKSIGTAWQQWNQVKEMHANYLAQLQAKLPLITYNYNLLETPEIPTDFSSKLLITINPTGAFPLPKIVLPGYTTETDGNKNNFFKDGNIYLKYNERQTIKERTLTLDPLNILEAQNAWSGVELTRNKLLIEGRTTNPKFIYKTPLVKFYNKLVPLLVCNSIINVAEIGSPNNPQSRTLAEHLKKLIDTVTENKDKLDQTIKLECLYKYNLEGVQTFNIITLPILLATPTQLAVTPTQEVLTNPGVTNMVGEGDFVTNMNTVISNWFKRNNPNQNRGNLVFKIEVFSIDNNQLPVLKMNNVILSLAYVTDIKK